MTRQSEIVTSGAVSVETYVDGRGPAIVIVPVIGCCVLNHVASPARLVR